VVDCVDALELEGSLHDDDNVYHYRPVRPKDSDDRDAVPKINHASAGGHHFNVDYPSDSKSEGDGGERSFVERASLMLSLGVGAGVLLVVLILGTACGVAVRNRRRRRRRKSVERTPPVVDSYALVPLSSRRPDVDPLPDVSAASPRPRRSPSSAATTPRSARRTPVPSASVQQLEWQRMLRTTECDDVINYEDEDEDEAGPPLPPPPAFLLRAGGAGGCRAPLVADEILDGYHSGDNVDDDIERIGYVGAPARPQHVNRR